MTSNDADILCQEFESNLYQLNQSVADDVLQTMRFPILSQAFGSLSSPVLWKFMGLYQKLSTPEETSVLLCLLTDYLTTEVGDMSNARAILKHVADLWKNLLFKTKRDHSEDTYKQLNSLFIDYMTAFEKNSFGDIFVEAMQIAKTFVQKQKKEIVFPKYYDMVQFHLPSNSYISSTLMTRIWKVRERGLLGQDSLPELQKNVKSKINLKKMSGRSQNEKETSLAHCKGKTLDDYNFSHTLFGQSVGDLLEDKKEEDMETSDYSSEAPVIKSLWWSDSDSIGQETKPKDWDYVSSDSGSYLDSLPFNPKWSDEEIVSSEDDLEIKNLKDKKHDHVHAERCPVKDRLSFETLKSKGDEVDKDGSSQVKVQKEPIIDGNIDKLSLISKLKLSRSWDYADDDNHSQEKGRQFCHTTPDSEYSREAGYLRGSSNSKKNSKDVYSMEKEREANSGSEKKIEKYVYELCDLVSSDSSSDIDGLPFSPLKEKKNGLGGFQELVEKKNRNSDNHSPSSSCSILSNLSAKLLLPATNDLGDVDCPRHKKRKQSGSIQKSGDISGSDSSLDSLPWIPSSPKKFFCNDDDELCLIESRKHLLTDLPKPVPHKLPQTKEIHGVDRGETTLKRPPLTEMDVAKLSTSVNNLKDEKSPQTGKSYKEKSFGMKQPKISDIFPKKV